jgi:hypothetical protein
MMKKGEYYVGDLCYVLDSYTWDRLCDLRCGGYEPLDGELELPDGRRFAMFQTAYGDGVYEGSCGGNYLVDSGSIGCVKVSDLSPEYQDDSSWGHFIEFDDDFTVESDDGVIRIGHVEINTN